jgi:hypothetical protein
MATIAWEPVATHWCDLQGCEAQLLEQRAYPADQVPDTGVRFKVLARKCSFGVECNLAGYACRWAWTNPDYDPFAA